MRLPALAVVLLAATACGNLTRLEEKQRPARAEDAPVAVFYEKDPPRPFQPIAVYRTEGDNLTKFLDHAKDACRKAGGDAVIIHPNAGHYVDNGPVRDKGGVLAEAIIVVWSEQVGDRRDVR